MFYRLYTGNDGQSHMEEYNPPDILPVASVVFRRHEPGNFIDWHIAPRRQFIVTLEGQVEIGLGDGSIYTLGPGDMAHFPLGMKTHWHVRKAVRKFFVIRTPEPFEL